MLGLSFVELKSVETSERSERRFSCGNVPLNSFAFMISNYAPEKIVARDVTNKLNSYDYNLTTPYAIIYLYDYLNDTESADFIKIYGGRLHNNSSSNISILTYFTEDMPYHWTNVQFRDQIKIGTNNDYNEVIKTVNKIKNAYNVDSLPAMIITKKINSSNEEYVSLNMAGYKKDDLYSYFNKAMNIIRDNCEEDFSKIASLITDKNSIHQSGGFLHGFNTYDFVEDLVKEKSRNKEYGFSLDDLAVELNISVRTLLNKRTNRTFTRNECVFIGIYFNTSITELNKLLLDNEHTELDFREEDSLIKKCLIEKYDIYQAEELFKNKGYKWLV